MLSFFKRKSINFDASEGLPVNRVRKGHSHKITKITADKGNAQKLMELGLPMGSIVKVLQHQAGGGAVVAKGNLRIALGPMIASQIIVSPL